MICFESDGKIFEFIRCWQSSVWNYRCSRLCDVVLFKKELLYRQRRRQIRLRTYWKQFCHFSIIFFYFLSPYSGMLNLNSESHASVRASYSYFVARLSDFEYFEFCSQFAYPIFHLQSSQNLWLVSLN